MANQTQSKSRAQKARVMVVRDYLNGYEQELVDARELHKKLEAGGDFSRWIKHRIDQCELVEGVDFIKVPHMMTICSMGIDYRLSPLAALQLAIMQRPPKSKSKPETASA
jgi:phage anti-repressor protein